LQSRQAQNEARVSQQPEQFHSRNVAVDDLHHDQIATVGHDIKGLSLNIGILISAPPQVVLGQLGIGGLLGLLGDRLNGLGAIDGLLSARNTCEATYSMVNQYGRYYTSKRDKIGEVAYVDLSQFIMGR
jgi:hypothetical protein